MMKRIALIFVALVAPFAALAQTGSINGFCTQGAIQSVTNGASSTNYLQGVVPACTVTVYLTGTTTLATIYSNSTNTSLANPFKATYYGQWLFYAPTGQGYDVVLTGGTYPNFFNTPLKFTDLFPGSGAGAGTITPSPQFQIPYYSAPGTGSTLTGSTGLTANGTGTLSAVQLNAGQYDLNCGGSIGLGQLVTNNAGMLDFNNPCGVGIGFFPAGTLDPGPGVEMGATDDDGDTGQPYFQVHHFSYSSTLKNLTGIQLKPSFSTTLSLPSPVGIDAQLTSAGASINTMTGLGGGTGYTCSGCTVTITGGTLASGSPPSCTATAPSGVVTLSCSGTNSYTVPPLVVISGATGGTLAVLSGYPSLATDLTETSSLVFDPAGGFHWGHTALKNWTSAASDIFTIDSSGNVTDVLCTSGQFIKGDGTGCGTGTGVSSLNSLTGALNITAGAGITVTPSGSNIQVAATGSAVTSVSNSDGTLTVTPTTGPVVASLNLAHANTWTAAIVSTGTVTASGFTNSAATGSSQCAQYNSSGQLLPTGSPCGSGSGSVSGSGTGGVLPIWTGTGSSTTLGNGPLDYGNTIANTLTSTAPENINNAAFAPSFNFSYTNPGWEFAGNNAISELINVNTSGAPVYIPGGKIQVGNTQMILVDAWQNATAGNCTQFQGVNGYPYVSGFTSTFSNGVTSITVSSSTGLVVGMNLYGAGIATGTTITVVNGTTLTLSLATTASETAVSLSATNGTGTDCALAYAIYHDTNTAETCQGEVVIFSSGDYNIKGAYNDAGGCSPTTTGGFGISLAGQDMDTTRLELFNCNGQPYWWQFYNSSLFTSVRFENFTMVGFGYLQDCGFIGIYGAEHIDIRHVHGFNSDNHPVDGILRTTSLGNYNSSGLFIGDGYENAITLYKQENPTNTNPAIVDAGDITFATDTLTAPAGYGSGVTQPHPNAITAITLSQTCDTTGTNWGTSNQPCVGKTISSNQVARISPYYDLSSPTSSNQTVNIKYKNPPRIVATADGTAAGHSDPYNIRFSQVPNVDPLYARGTVSVSGSILNNSYQNACSTQPSWTSNFYGLTNAYSTSASGWFIDANYPVTIWPTLNGNLTVYGFTGTYSTSSTTVTLVTGSTANFPSPATGTGSFIFSNATGIPNGAYVVSITDSTHFVLSATPTATQASAVNMSFSNGTITGTPSVQFAGSNLTRVNLYGGGTINPSYAPYGVTISLIGKTEPGSFGVQWLPTTSTYTTGTIVSYGGLFYQGTAATIPAGTLPTNASYWSAYTSGPATYTPSYSGGTLSGVTYSTGSLSGYQTNQYTYLSTQINVLDANGAIARSFLSKGPGSNCPPDINILLLDIVQQDYAISVNTPDSTYIDLISSAGGYTAIYGTSTSNFYHPHPYYNVIGMQLPGGTIKDMEDDTQYWRAMILGLGAGTAFASTDATHFINYGNWKNPTPNFFHNKSEWFVLNQALITPGATLGNVTIQNDHCFNEQDEGNYHFLSGISGPADLGQASPTTGLDFPQMTVTQAVACAWNGQTFNYHTANTTTAFSPAPTFLIPQTTVGVSYPTQTFTISGISTPAWAVPSGGAPYGFANFTISPGFTGGIGGGYDSLGVYLPSQTVITLTGTPNSAGGNPSPQFEQTTIYDSNGIPHSQKFVMKGGLGGQITVGGTGVTCTNFACSVTATWTQGSSITPLAITPTCAGCTAPYHYYLSSGRLPPGVSLTGTGTYYGTPVLAGTYNWQVTTNDATSVPGGSVGNISVTTWTVTITAATVPTYVVTVASGPAAIGQIYTIGAAAGSGPTVPTCVLGYWCNDTSGTVSFTTGSSTPTMGTVLTLNVAPNFNYNYSNCYAVATEQASPFTVNVLQATDTIQNNGLGQQIAFGVTGNTALVANEPYQVTYNGCSQN